MWRVWEASFSAMDRRSGNCLLFEADGVVRRVRNYPPDWKALDDAALYELCLKW